MMARIKETPPPSAQARASVPADLLSWDAAPWQDQDHFRSWVAEHLDPPPSITSINHAATGYDGFRHRCAASWWAVSRGYINPDAPKQPDWPKLADLGVRPMGALDRARRGAAAGPSGRGYPV